MAVRLGLEFVIEHKSGTEPSETERSLAEKIEWLNSIGPHTSAYNEVMAHLALTLARRYWRDADTYRRLEEQRAARLAKAAAKRRDTMT